MKIYDISRFPSEITLGYDGENNWRPQKFDCSVLLKNHPSGVITLWLLPDGESQAFPVALTRDGNSVIWTPLDEEMTARNGALQIVCVDGTDVGKSDVVLWRVDESIVPGAEHPAAVPSWAVRVVEATGHYPRIINGNWYVWDVQNAEWADTGVSASGGEISPEDIAQAVEDYLDAHPVQVEEHDPKSVHFEGAQNLTDTQQAQARGNIGAPAASTLSSMLIPILRNGLYGTDQTAAISALEAALGGTPPVQTCVITNYLTNVINSNEATAINSGSAYTATLTPASGMEMQSVTITMGGVDVTASVYSNGAISIATVTGDVVITAVAESLIETYTPTLVEGYYIVANGTEYDHTSYTRTPVIPCREGDKVYGTCENSSYPGSVVNYIRARWTAAYDNNGTAIESAGSNTQYDYSQSSPYVVPSGVYGVVFSMVNALANDVVIYVDKSERVGA